MDFNILNGSQEITQQNPIPPTITDPFDPEPLVALFSMYHKQIDNMETQALQLTVTDDKSNNVAVEMTTQAKKLTQIIEKKRVEKKEPYLKVTRVLDGETGGLKGRLETIQQMINRKIKPYLQAKEEERRRKEREAQEAARKEQQRLDAERRAEEERLAEEARQKAIEEGKDEKEAELDAQQAAALAEPAPVVVSNSVPEETKTETDTGTAKLNTKWTWDIEDFSKLPPEVFEARRKEIVKAMAPYFNAQVKAGIRNIPGVKIYQEMDISTRTK